MLVAFNRFTIAWVLGRSWSLQKNGWPKQNSDHPFVLVATTEGNGATRFAKRYKHLTGRGMKLPALP